MKDLSNFLRQINKDYRPIDYYGDYGVGMCPTDCSETYYTETTIQLVNKYGIQTFLNKVIAKIDYKSIGHQSTIYVLRTLANNGVDYSMYTYKAQLKHDEWMRNYKPPRWYVKKYLS